MSTGIHPFKNIKGSMVKYYLYSKKWEKDMVVIIDVYGARAVLVLFCGHQDTKSE